MDEAARRDAQTLVRRSVEGDREAFEMLVRLHQEEIHRFFRRACRSDEDARDQTQLAFVRAYRSLAGFEGRASFRTWLFRIATNLARNYHRDRGRRPEVPLTVRGADGGGQRERAIPAGGRSVLESMEHGERRGVLREAVRSLPPRQRAVVVWRIYHDMSYAEIAQVESITANNAKVSFCHAVKNLKKALANHGSALDAGGTP